MYGLKLMTRTTMKKSLFRAFCYEQFMANKDECRWYRIPCRYKTFASYWKSNKSFLKRKWKERNDD